VILRLSEKLKTKIKAGPLQTLPLDENPFADWSASLFVADRTQYILFCNTKSLYSTVFYAQGITNESYFITRCLDTLREFMESDNRLDIYERLIAPTTRSVILAKSLNRKIIGSITELEKSAKIMLVERDLSPHQVGFHLNDILLSAIAINPKDGYSKPNKAFQMMVDGTRKC
jgi:hypothetical protein